MRRPSREFAAKSGFPLGDDSVLHHDCIPNPAYPDYTTVTTHDLATTDVNGDGNIDEGDNVDTLCDTTTVSAARTAYAMAHPHSIVVFPRNAGYPWWNDKLGHWVRRGSNFSSCKGWYVAMDVNLSAGGANLAHEVGHYLCSPHPFNNTKSTVAEVAALIKDQVESHGLNRNDATAVMSLFDFDAGSQFLPIPDTPPDAGMAVFTDAYGAGNECLAANGSVLIPVTFSDNVKKIYALAPMRTNVMSYWGCQETPTMRWMFSPGQVAAHHLALDTIKHRLLESDNYNCGRIDPITKANPFQHIAFLANCIRAYRTPLPGETQMFNALVNNPKLAVSAHTMEMGGGAHRHARAHPRSLGTGRPALPGR